MEQETICFLCIIRGCVYYLATIYNVVILLEKRCDSTGWWHCHQPVVCFFIVCFLVSLLC